MRCGQGKFETWGRVSPDQRDHRFPLESATELHTRVTVDGVVSPIWLSHPNTQPESLCLLCHHVYYIIYIYILPSISNELCHNPPCVSCILRELCHLLPGVGGGGAISSQSVPRAQAQAAASPATEPPASQPTGCQRAELL